MSDVKISALPAAVSVAASDLLPIVQRGVTKKATVGQVQSGGASATLLQGSIVATEDIPAFAPVTSQGKIANSANPSATIGKVIGLALAAILNGFSGSVAEAGEVTNGAWAWTVGDLIFLNGTTLSSSPPATGFIQSIGTAKAPTIIVVELGQPFTF